ncbi:MAG: HDOD domain-containing protein [Pseudodesulfovibrio sp.]|uniref:Metal-dependent hydrolase HDOD n=1 Tax=Pseudodesulfovibrio aespoeensis (strain ATCC 700646 / DSM 10631 / Aspo-2) TaxID=643562 RepID=E6VTY3_PSEA9|nr:MULTISPECIES: HDOD domain-containing protein [Pseudodesulfovibrio]MBU4244094.1 HDOD domain-containing protein [Pseudomonadota bacterium]ADU61075.1 Metal-dependent hydrolase HDOD [Pseudodesulfovibrio aespoeensis Aspo-2]MBU4379319.1 HDOD domain-containing protein [Pseudomonadota bacterium]MBU4476455.1 HDOD domain-containing protein [Pseudomonadota bacterium]MBU4517449.1 HDOD domain-containing protein [Pseudomonadota bacterium]
MALTPLDQLTAGMVLSGDLKSADGRLLFRSGTPLEARHIELLRRVGVSGAEVEPPASELPPETLREIEEYVRGFFLYANPDSAPVIAMFRMALEMTGEAVSKGWQLPDANTRRAASVEHMQDIFLKGMGTPETIARHETELASFPDIYFRIREVLEDESASSARIAKVVGTDMSLSAKLIKLVNSPLYGLSQPIDSISRAVTLVGAKELSTLALGISAINYFKDIPHELVDMRTFWRHSITCGIFAKILAGTQVGISPERSFIAGLLHDVGRLILFKKLPYASTEAMLFARENSIPLVEAERAVMDFTHTDISRPLLAAWKFPEELADMINYHHNPMEFPNPLEPAIVHVADCLTNAVEIAQGGMYVVPDVDEDAWELLGLDAETVLVAAADRYCEQIDNILEAFF